MYSTACGTMDEEWLRQHIPRFEQERDRLSHGVPSLGDVEALLKMLGRHRVKRGKEPAWESVVFPKLRPITSIHKKSRKPSRFTLQSIIDYADSWDISAYQQLLEELIHVRQRREAGSRDRPARLENRPWKRQR